MQQYYECPPLEGLVVEDGASRTFAVPYPTRQRLTRMSVLQTAGDPVTFTVDLYNREVPDVPSAGDADEFWRVTDAIPADAAGRLHHRFPNVDVYFQNQNAPVYVQRFGADTPSLVSIFGNRKIYVRITNQGVNDATFKFVLGSESQS